MLEQSRAVTVSVHYHDYLSVTLPHNKEKFSDILVVTHPDDEKTLDVCRENDVQVFTTEVFYERNAKFNKYAAIEQSLDYFGRQGWMTIIDADTCMSGWAHEVSLDENLLYIPRRRMAPADTVSIPEERLWRRFKLDSGNERRTQMWSGYCQIFHASCRRLNGIPWFETTWSTAAGPDTRFSDLWPESERRRTAFEVLHIGHQRENWAGRVTPFQDGTLHPNSVINRASLETILKQRRGKTGDDRYALEKLKGD